MTLGVLQQLATLRLQQLPGFTCPLIDEVLRLVCEIKKLTWDAEKQSVEELRAAIAVMARLAVRIPPLMERIRFANSELRVIAEPAANLGQCADDLLALMRRHLAENEKLTVEQIDTVFAAYPLSRRGD